MTPFGLMAPARILFGRGEAAKAAGLIAGFGERVLVVHGASLLRAEGLILDLTASGCELQLYPCASEPTVAMLEEAIYYCRGFEPQVVVAIGGGAVLDLGKALAAMLPASTPLLDHLEVVGRGRALPHAPLPFVALPTTSGTGAEATKNAVLGVPDQGRKVSLRDGRMLARLAIIDPALTDHCPRGVTLASGLDAITQVIEPFVCTRANAFTDALTRPAIGMGLRALRRLMQSEDAVARDQMAWVSLCGGLALANAGLGVVHGLAGVIGGVTTAAHGAICGALLGPAIAANRAKASGQASERLAEVCALIAAAFDCSAQAAPETLTRWSRSVGLPNLAEQGLRPDQHASVAAAALAASSMKANPVALSPSDLVALLQAASSRRG